jgi:uncharacterized protein (DUF2336 family)
MASSPSLITELETTLASGSSPQRRAILRRVTDLFVTNADNYSNEQVAVFDDVMGYLIKKIEQQALVELSRRIAPLQNPPARVVQRLSRDQDIAVAGPLLEQSPILSDSFLLEIAMTRSQSHLAAIAGRRQIAPQVTDVLVDRGSLEVARKVAANDGARFSNHGYGKVAMRAETDEDLAAALATRADVPPAVFEQLVRKATDTVRQRLMRDATPAMRERITQTLSNVARDITRAAGPAETATTIRPSQEEGAPLRVRLAMFAKAGNQPDTIATIAQLSGVPANMIRNIVRRDADEAIIIVGKAVGLTWPEVKDVLTTLMPERAQTEGMNAQFEKFVTLKNDNAQRVLRFLKTSNAAALGENKTTV